MNLIITIIIVLLVSYAFTLLAKRFNIPSVVALITGGLIMGYPFLKDLIIEPNTKFMFSMGNIALLCLMFLAGLESSWKALYKEKRDAVFIAFFAALIPFSLGFIVFKFLGFSLVISLIMGICMSITAEATKARVLMELRKLRTKVGSAIIGAGIIDDIFGLLLFLLVAYLFKTIYLKEMILIISAIVIFFAGILVQKIIKRDNPVMKTIEWLLLIAVIPFFFVSMGIHFDLNSLLINPYLLVIIITIAITGKIIGTFLAKPFTKFNWKQLHLIGWGMNSRGAIELALALIAFRNFLIPVELYSSLVIMALTTTLIFPFIIAKMIKKNPKIMD